MSTETLPITPRRIKAGDLAEFARMRTRLWSDSTHTDAEAALQAHQQGDLFLLVVERPDGAGLCAFVEAAIRPHAEGCVTAPVGYLEGIWVDDDVRRAGIAEALVEGVAEWAKRRGLKELGSDTEVMDDGSRCFHEAVGFEDVGTIVCFRRKL
jgi:aminoglycoside 6'-N-acetyltransferase I